MTFTLAEDGSATPFSMNYDYETKGGPRAPRHTPPACITVAPAPALARCRDCSRSVIR